MIKLAAQMLRRRIGSALATLLALAVGVVILTAMGTMVESGLRHKPQAERYAQTTPDNTTLHHPRSHLTEKLAGCTDAATAYSTICRYMDNDSEAREQGDFTKDRDERLALGAGLGHKQRAWTWIVHNT